MAITVTHSKTLVAPDTGSEDKVYGQDYVSASSHTLNGFGTGVETALAVNVGTAGAVVVNGGALGTPLSGTLTNATGLPEGGLSLTDITTNNASTSKHGFLLKLNNSASFYMDGTGTWSTPVGTLAIGKAVTGGNANSLLIEDASSNLAAPSGLTWGPTAGQGLAIAAGTATTAVSPLAITWTQNSAGTTFSGITGTVTNTASAANSSVLKLLNGANTLLDVQTATNTAATGLTVVGGAAGSMVYLVATSSAAADGISFVTKGGAAATRFDFRTQIGGNGPDYSMDMNNGVFAGGPGTVFAWTNDSRNATGVKTTGLSQISVGVVGVGTGANGSIAGSMQMTKLYLDYTNTGTVGSVTINKASGRVNLGAGGTTLTLTNSVITAASHIFLNSDGAPGNLVAVQFYAVPSAGSCTINAVPAVTNQTAIDFVVINAD